MKKSLFGFADKKTGKSKGFTLIEILVVIGIIAILAAIVIIAINPAKQFAQARNTQRQAGVNTILNAIGQRIADNKGIFAGSFTVGGNTYNCPSLPAAGTVADITDGVGGGTDINLECLKPTYVSNIPEDPDSTVNAAVATGFTMEVDSTGRIEICAPRATSETSIPGSPAICVLR